MDVIGYDDRAFFSVGFEYFLIFNSKTQEDESVKIDKNNLDYKHQDFR